MSVKMHGPRRGFAARWLMRFEAAGQVLKMGFLGVTAASTLSTALSVMGEEWLVPWVLAIGFIGTVALAYVLVDWGVFGRKNRERDDHMRNFARPSQRIDDEMIARGIVAAEQGSPLTREQRRAAKSELDETYGEYRDGYDSETSADVGDRPPNFTPQDQNEEVR